MTLWDAALTTVIAVPAYDWLMVTGSAAKMTSFDYAYWPPSRLRVGGVALLALGLFTTLSLAGPGDGDGNLWKLVPGFVAIAIHCGIVMRDIFAQRRRAREASRDPG